MASGVVAMAGVARSQTKKGLGVQKGRCASSACFKSSPGMAGRFSEGGVQLMVSSTKSQENKIKRWRWKNCGLRPKLSHP